MKYLLKLCIDVYMYILSKPCRYLLKLCIDLVPLDLGD